MLRTLIFLTFLIPAFSFAQYIHYTDNSIARNVVARNMPRRTEPVLVPVKPSSNKGPEWFTGVDCPGRSASLPVLYSYVPPELVDKLSSRYKGHLFCITAIKSTINAAAYKLKVCATGEFKDIFIDSEGEVLEER